MGIIFTLVFSTFLMVVNHRIIRHYYYCHNLLFKNKTGEKNASLITRQQQSTWCSPCFESHTHTHKNDSFLVSEKHKTSLPVTSVLLGLHTHGRGARSLCCLRLRQRRAFAISQLEKYSSRQQYWRQLLNLEHITSSGL